jgi:hypothetical protein
MNQIVLLHSCDVHHTYTSQFLHGAFSSVDNAINALKEMLAKADDEGGYVPLSQEQEDLLRRINQTQGYKGPGEFLLQILPVDELAVIL